MPLPRIWPRSSQPVRAPSVDPFQIEMVLTMASIAGCVPCSQRARALTLFAHWHMADTSGAVPATGGGPHVYSKLFYGVELHKTISAMSPARSVENIDVTLIETESVSVTAMITRQPETEKFFYTSIGIFGGGSAAEVSFQEVDGRAYAAVALGDITFVCGRDGDDVDHSVGNGCTHPSCAA